jgi:hypothetical protein
MAHKPSDDKFFDDERLTTYQPIPFCAQMKRLWRRTDLYALPITLRYKGEKMFYTNYGALISNVVIVTLMAFTLSYLQIMWSDSELYSTYSEKISSQKTD